MTTRFFRMGAAALVLFVGQLGTVAQASHSNEPTVAPFRFEQYFQGPIHARGFVKNRGGEIIRRFWAEIIGTWDDASQTLTLDEILHFDDGENLERVWQIERRDGHHYVGRAADVDGDAIGEIDGLDGILRYTLNIRFKGVEVGVDIDDFFHAVSDDVLFNRTEMSKFGFRVGTVSTVFYKGSAVPPAVAQQDAMAKKSEP